MSKVFISHSSKDKPRIEPLREFLEGDDIPYWVDDQGILVGDDAPKELRAAIQDCACCIFYATRNSLDSQWCLIETAAFWGAGKPVLAYLAEPDVTREKLPEHLRNASPSTSLKAVRERAARLVADARKAATAPPPPAVVAAAALEEAIRRAVGMAQVRRSLQDRLLLVRGMLSISDEFGAADDGFRAVLDGHLAALRGFSREELADACAVQWPHRIRVLDGGKESVSAFGGRRVEARGAVEFSPCILLSFAGGYSDGAVAVRRLAIGAGGVAEVDVMRVSGNAGVGAELRFEDGGAEDGPRSSAPAWHDGGA